MRRCVKPARRGGFAAAHIIAGIDRVAHAFGAHLHSADARSRHPVGEEIASGWAADTAKGASRHRSDGMTTATHRLLRLKKHRSTFGL